LREASGHISRSCAAEGTPPLANIKGARPGRQDPSPPRGRRRRMARQFRHHTYWRAVFEPTLSHPAGPAFACEELCGPHSFVASITLVGTDRVRYPFSDQPCRSRRLRDKRSFEPHLGRDRTRTPPAAPVTTIGARCRRQPLAFLAPSPRAIAFPHRVCRRPRIFLALHSSFPLPQPSP